MDQTPNFHLPYIAANQNQKHVTHNEALRLLDALLYPGTVDHQTLLPPPLPEEGNKWIIPSNAEGSWSGKEHQLAVWQDGSWNFYTPSPGFTVWLLSCKAFYVFNGSNWEPLQGAPLLKSRIQSLGIGLETEPGRGLAVKTNTILLTALEKTSSEPQTSNPEEPLPGTGDLRLVLNKENNTNILSFIYQTNFSGRAETGLIGDEHFQIKVSPDGEEWKVALDIDPTTARVSFPHGFKLGSHLEDSWASEQRPVFHSVALKQGWQIYAEEYATPAYGILSSQQGMLQGVLSGPYSSQISFAQLPAAARPNKTLLLPIAAANFLPAYLRLMPTGEMFVHCAASPAWVSLDGLMYPLGETI